MTLGSKGQNSTFTEHKMHIKFIGIMKHSNMVTNILPADPSPAHLTLGMGSRGLNSTFSEHGHVAYHKCTNMVANILPAYPLHLTLGMRSIGQNSIFLEHSHVAYQIKWNPEI